MGGGLSAGRAGWIGGSGGDVQIGGGPAVSTGGSASGGVSGTEDAPNAAGAQSAGGGAPSAGGGTLGGAGSAGSASSGQANAGSDQGSSGNGTIGMGGMTGAARTATNIYYAGTKAASQTLDLLLPGNARLPLPLVIRFHGGGFSGGSKSGEEVGAAARAILAQGYALASVNYRLSGEAKFPAGAQDAKAAVRWLRANATQYGLDAARFASWGESAGGYLAVLLGVTGKQSTVFDDDTLGNPGVSSAVAAVVDWYGPVDLATMDGQQSEHPPLSCPTSYLQHTPAGSPEGQWLGGALTTAAVTTKLMQANLASYVATGMVLPRFVIAHGDDDCQVPWGQSQELSDALAKVGNTASLTILTGAGHADARFESTQTSPALKQLASLFGR